MKPSCLRSAGWISFLHSRRFVRFVDQNLSIEFDKPIDDLASRLIPTLGTQDFFELI